MNSNIRRHSIYRLKCDAKNYVVRLLRNYGYIGSDNAILSYAIFDVKGRYAFYDRIHFRKFWQLICLPTIVTLFSQPNLRYENFEDYQITVEWAHSFIIEQVEEYIHW